MGSRKLILLNLDTPLPIELSFWVRCSEIQINSHDRHKLYPCKEKHIMLINMSPAFTNLRKT